MSRNSDYKNLKELTKSLAKGIDKLESGKLSANELSNLLEDARNLHERVTVLQYLAFEKEVKAPNKKMESKKPKKEAKKQQGSFELNFGTPEIEKEVVAEIKVDEDEAHPNQINLLDAIEEHIEPEIIVEEQEVVEEDSQPLSEEKPQEVSSQKQTEDKPNTTIKSINEKFASEKEGKTLADKLSRQPISNLKEAIGLNQKFLFMNDLFEGENTLFNDAVDTINSFENLEQAMEFVESDLVPKFKWENDHKSVINFINLVERRFVA